ncbi:MAG: magnesium chelatase [Sphingomonadales bacterium RIFCSPHIGHO2_01_FULL_65_20]|jgi:magnesium chelatase subunit D|uniref:magnesium chelatase subunit D n=2 Tax=unclassified Blastomonas TaxID=2626550 RepID=UPI0008CF6679|nr:magnesium chelatase subunit D [Blastomonas sp.]MCH2237702.1 magnesium chelatase subunit D [Blastomonas sp.]OHC96660.1 MAG: magnesium chelatase [Sphingomonadales bacterium RIFCSPHIGHO2_01_FULL_65_20]
MTDTLTAARLLAAAPARLGGIWLRGAGPEREAALALLMGAFQGRPVRRVPVHIDEERLCGGLDVAASLAAGHRIEQTGLLHEAAGGLLVVPMAERMSALVAGRIAQAMDAGAGFALVLLDDGGEDEAPPVALTERVGFWCEGVVSTKSVESQDNDPSRLSRAKSRDVISDGCDTSLDTLGTNGGGKVVASLANLSLALGVDSARALLFALTATRLHAQWNGRDDATEDDLAFAARAILGPRATRMPQQAEEPPPPPEAEDEPPPGDAESEQEQHDPDALDDLILAAALASIPKDVLARIGEGRSARRATGAGGAGRKRASQLRGKPLGARPGLPRGGARLALIDTLRAAVPWQEIRRQQEAADAPKRLRIRKGDLRIRRFEERAEALTIFAVDASGSSALARLAEAKGAVELMLAQSYVKRAQVALIAFRGTSAELLLPPTRSLTRAKKVLGELPGGGGTPLALGLAAAAELAETQAARGRTPFVALLTDGKGNIDKHGQPGRAQAGEDALAAARRFAGSGTQGVVIDISARPQPEAAAIAAAMRARYLALPRADARGVEQAVSALQFGKAS